jgi:hypothetical protein
MRCSAKSWRGSSAAFAKRMNRPTRNGMRKLTSKQARAMAAKRKTHGRGKSTGRPKGSFSDQPRCRCGKMTAGRAAARGHKC